MGGITEVLGIRGRESGLFLGPVEVQSHNFNILAAMLGSSSQKSIPPSQWDTFDHEVLKYCLRVWMLRFGESPGSKLPAFPFLSK